MNYWGIILVSAAYLGMLALVAYFADRRASRGTILLNNPYIYALSLSVYCTAWTFYGSVGKAAADGSSFLAIYLGPVISMPLWWLVVRKIIQVCNALKITTLADFIATRFGKHIGLSVLVTLLSVMGIVPYISLQLKAINSSLKAIAGDAPTDTAFFVTLLLGVFILIFTFRTVDSSKKHNGLVTAIAVESIVKLVAFLVVGSFITYFMFDGFGDIFSRATADQIAKFEIAEGLEWPVTLFLSTSAVLFLPRQFHLIVAENTNPNHLKTVLWLFPAYLLVINIFVIPVALGGENLLGGLVDPDLYVLALPLHAGQNAIALMTYIGGFSAATGMIIISTIALSMMVSNNLVMPLIIRQYDLSRINQRKALLTRRFSVIIILLMAFLYFRFVSDRFSLVYIGLISFSAVAQFTPLVLASLYWKDVTRRGAVWSLIAGFSVWFFTMVIPTMIEVGLIDDSILRNGLLGLSWLKPTALFWSDMPNPVVHGTFWALLFNVFFLVIGTITQTQTAKERNMANFYTEAYLYSSDFDNQLIWKGSMIYKDLIRVLENILGVYPTKVEIEEFRRVSGSPVLENGEVSPQFVNHAERMLTGAIGASSARMLIASISKEEEIELSEVVEILKENQEISRLNRQLSTKSQELELQTRALEMANMRLMNLDEEKDDFISTVTHEMRTPLTSIRAISEIIHDNPDLTEEERTHFLTTVIKETERMTRLINQVLDLEKLESGRAHLNKEQVNLVTLLEDELSKFAGMVMEKHIQLKRNLPESELWVWLDHDRMTQVITNLISNALKFSPEYSTLEIGVKQTVAGVLIWVKDQGKGIDQESLQRIFDKFYQANDQTRKKPKGTGLGLSISKRIVNMHGGDIWADSELEKGTTFYVTVPTHPDENK